MKNKCIKLTILVLLSFFSLINNSSLNYDSPLLNQGDNEERDFKIENELESSAPFYVVSENLTSIMNVSLTTTLSSDVAKFPNIAIDSNDIVHAVWQVDDGGDASYDIYYSTYNSTKHEDGWSTPFPVSADETNNNENPDIYIDQNNIIHVVWSWDDGANYYIRYRNKTSSGWQDIEDVYSDSSDPQVNPVIAVSNSKKMVIWEDGSASPDIYYNVIDYSSTFTDSRVALTTKDINRDPQITCDSAGTFQVVYYNRSGSLYYISYTNYSGSSFSSKQYLNNDLTSSLYAERPDITARNNMIVACWSDEKDTGNYQIFYRNKTRTGDWNEPMQLTSESFDNCRARVELDSEGCPWFVWVEDRSGDDEVVAKKPSGIKYTLTEDGSKTTTASNTRDSIAINSYDSVFAIYDSNDRNDVLLRKLDRYGPHLSVTSPTNGTICAETVELRVDAIEFDFKNITYDYWNDTIQDGIPNASDSSFWKRIYSTDSYASRNYDWDTTGFNFPQIIIRVSVKDINGLEDNIYRRITVDDVIPNRSKIVDFTDSLNHNSSHPHDDKRFTRNVTVRVNISDDNSGVNKVDLMSDQTGTTILATNSSVITPISTLKFKSKTISDGTYDFYIRTYDASGNYNESTRLSNIYIDNTVPVPNIREEEDTKFTNGDEIDIDLSSYDDIKNVSYYWYYPSNPSEKHLLETDIDGSNGWNYTVNFDTYFNARIAFEVNATDQTGLTAGNMSYFYIDTTPPQLMVENTPSEIGYSYNFKIIFKKGAGGDIDTKTVAAFYRGSVSQSYIKSANITNVAAYMNEHPDYESENEYYVILQCNFFQIQASWSKMQLLIKAVDDKNLKSEKLISDISITKDPPEDIKSIESEVKGYNITLSWTKSSGADEYLIFMSQSNLYDIIDIESYNLLNITEKISFLKNKLGFEIGEYYCINRVSFSDDQDPTYELEVNGPNTFYFIVIPMKSGNPGNGVYETVVVQAENPSNKSIQDNPTNYWFYYFMIFLGVIVIIYFVQIKKIKKKYFKGRVKEETSKVIEKELARFESKEFSLDSKVQTEQVIKTSPKWKTKKEKPIISSELGTKSIMEEEVKSFEDIEKIEKPKIEKCPTCGWILSSAAIKCPRCGWIKPTD